MRRGWRTYGLLFVCLVSAVAYYGNVSAKTQEAEAVASITEKLEQNSIAVTDATVRMSVTLPKLTGAKALAEQNEAWAAALQISPDPAVEKENGVFVYQNTAVFAAQELQYRLVGVPNTGKLDAYLVVTVKGKRNHLQDIVNKQQNVIKLLQRQALIPQISTCIAGIYNDTLSVDQQEERIFSIFRSLQASEIERLKDETVVSISGYTRLWDQAILSHNQKMNLQVAAHRDVEQKLTRFTVGTPIITAEY
ncbi:YwmB family TATA-box binding protein [Brevibacillus fluminis]|uniref:YwmB family TATA-box binding protein n=1 Tax=Brevibacillus fluminis TaxID=511487 RepID=UPI003F89736C